ncbi:hypothetical protein SpiGrapes_1160 [Sphaerochaeta pleomorpha str. Grapes]|uniref:DUF5723 domain-containing protein n=1 Tax=Sphaerochaeta pleomorpha (strain ATCC BAA-1885 / DSM 22778 / Grapes) TaxID=158190 RepID=G8QSL7_SPHPG|nr:hypothetical protein [Sphaerochaeta pleomorpha]AEV28978.1 hypothetical protein SpiGrapes_1160 [Sphaerochaeta pleomorpha str. Grapes]
MKNKKHLFIIIALVLLVTAPLVATSIYEPTTDAYAQTAEPFMGTSTRVMGMGGAGLGITGYYDSFLLNPANLGSGGLKISIPAITVTAFNPSAILESGMFEALDEGSLVEAAQDFLGVIGKNYGDVLTTDVSFVLGLGNFGLGLEAQERLMSYKTSADLTSTNLIAQVTMAATAGLGFRINAIPDVMSIDLGVSGKAIYKMYLEKQSASSITEMLGDDGADPLDSYLNDVPLIAGYSFPVNVGMNLNFPLGLTLSAVARNFNGTYYMSTYQSINDWSKEVLGESFVDDTNSDPFTSETFTTDAGWSLNGGLTWAPKLGALLKPIISVDVLDIMGLADLSEAELQRAFFERTHLGASVRLLSILDLRYGLSQGYQSFGVGFDLLIFHLDAAYYTMEYGDQIGSKPIDAVSLRFSLLSR